MLWPMSPSWVETIGTAHADVQPVWPCRFRISAMRTSGFRPRRRLVVLEPGEQIKHQRNYAGRDLRRGHRLCLRSLVGGFGRHARSSDLQDLLGSCYVVGAILLDLRRDRLRDLRAGADFGEYGCEVHDCVLSF